MLLSLELACLTLAIVSQICLIYALDSVPVPMTVRLGYRGLQRRRAMDQGSLFSSFEPLIRFGAGLMALLPLTGLRKSKKHDLQQADDYLGLVPDELFAMSLLSSLSLGAALFGLSAATEVVIQGGTLQKTWAITFLGLLLGLALPTMQVSEVIRARSKFIDRGLPHAIEVAAMCMGAGLDFPGALRQLCGKTGKEQDPLAREFSVILERLELGHTRKAALRGFAGRVPSDAVRDFVNAVVQAEEKGNPLAKVIQIQGRLLNMRRSVAAEEAAAKAGVLMIVPMVLQVACIMLLLMGPFIVTGVGF